MRYGARRYARRWSASLTDERAAAGLSGSPGCGHTTMLRGGCRIDAPAPAVSSGAARQLPFDDRIYRRSAGVASGGLAAGGCCAANTGIRAAIRHLRVLAYA